MNRARLNKVEGGGEASPEISRAIQERDAFLLDLFKDPRYQRERRVRRQLDLVPNDKAWWIKRRYNHSD